MGLRCRYKYVVFFLLFQLVLFLSCSTSISPKRHFLHTADYGISLLFSLLGRCNILYGPKYKYIVLRGRSAIAVVTRSSSRRLRHDRCAVIGLKIGPSDPDPTAVLSSSFPSSFPTLSMSSSLLYYFVIAPYVSSQQRKKIYCNISAVSMQ